MSSERCRILREGILDVKFPPNSPERVLHKAWKKLWVCATVLFPPGRGEPHLILQLMRGSQEKRLHSVKASRDGLRLFRCRSGSRPLRTWALSSTSSLLVYLAAESEQETQEWMQAIRDGLWPPIYNLGTSNIHDVSLIDDEKSFSSGILGLYGRLIRTSEDVISIIHPYWQGMLLRWKQGDVLSVSLVRKVGGERSVAGVFKITFRSSNKKERTLHFYSNTAILAVDWIQSKVTGSEKLTTKENSQKTVQLLSLPSQSNTSPSSTESEYAKIQKVTKQPDIPREVNNEIQRESSFIRKHIGNQTLANIPSEYLDTSISCVPPPYKDSVEQNFDEQCSLKIVVDDENDSDDSCAELYEHIYEDVVSRTASVGAYTLYEEIDDEESEYVPPLPPQLPNRPIQKPDSLRLLKLSESVAEALKLAEESHALVPPQPHPSSLLGKVVKKKTKSLQTSPSRETIPGSFDKKMNVNRTESAPNVISGIVKSDLTFNKSGVDTKNIDHENPHGLKGVKDLSGHNSKDKILSSKQTKTTEENLKGEQILDTQLVNRDSLTTSKNAAVLAKRFEGDYIDMR